MTTQMTLEQHVEELRAEYRNAASKRERGRIRADLRHCEPMLDGLEWQAWREASAAR